MGTKSSMRRALHHAMPNATADEAFDFGWKHGQGRYASKRVQEIEAESRRMQSQRDKARKGVAALQARIAELEREVRYLREYGNKDCTAMADEAMRGEAGGEQRVSDQSKTTYIGDGVYVTVNVHEQGDAMITTGDHREDHATNAIYLEPSVCSDLMDVLREAGGYEP